METHTSSTEARHGGGFGENAVSFGVTTSLPKVPSNPALNRSAQKLRFWVPSALRAPAPG